MGIFSFYQAPLHFNSLSWASVESAVEFFDCLPFWHLDQSRIAEIMKPIDDNSDAIHHDIAEQNFQVTDYKRENHYLDLTTEKRWAGKESLVAVAPQSYYAHLIRINHAGASSEQPKAAAVMHEGPTYAFTTRRAGQKEVEWSNPYLDSSQEYHAWFHPDMRSLGRSTGGTGLDVVCLAITELTEGGESTSTSVYSTGVVLAENLGQPGSYSRVGFFTFWFDSDAAFREARQKAFHRQLYII
ncbi:hypothetical protein B0T24DRAFT_716736 [Lasiosphaeria ovina]|uniref:Uncharacterized protein n=1 Tax=Lasiosphaeria ovina TaxID=92902 RepID=A0AAE0KLY2_9PEZI|nr:hypothetical protein B0T24DRAFT_716736 [Lasiosphaeria ovina]